MVEASKEVGNSTLDELRRQQEQIKDISSEVMLIEDNLTRADKLIRNFTKRMMTDKRAPASERRVAATPRPRPGPSTVARRRRGRGPGSSAVDERRS